MAIQALGVVARDARHGAAKRKGRQAQGYIKNANTYRYWRALSDHTKPNPSLGMKTPNRTRVYQGAPVTMTPHALESKTGRAAVRVDREESTELRKVAVHNLTLALERGRRGRHDARREAKR